jgi:hypothetical protein
VAPVPALPGPREVAAPVGPGAPYGSYQSEIYIAGMSAGVKPIFTTNLSDLEAPRRRCCPRPRAGTARLGGRSRRRASQRGGAVRVADRPADVHRPSERDLSTTVLGVTMPAPVILGPVGGQAVAHPDGETATARAAAGLQLTYVHSSLASRSLEEVAVAAPDGPRWFGLDWPGEDGPDPVLLTRARATGCTHLLLSPPAARAGLGAARGDPHGLGRADRPRRHPERAGRAMAVDRGLDGIVVSDERGRRGPARPGRSTTCRGSRTRSAAGRVLFGSGAITGTDVYRALALGAEAVLVGRPYVHGLALGGSGRPAHAPHAARRARDHPAIAGVENHRELGPSALVGSSTR